MVRTITLTLTLLLTLALSAQELTLDQILEKNLQAVGGMDAIKDVETLKITTKIVVGGMMEAPMSTIFKRPNMLRSETTIQGQGIVTAYDGSMGWMINPMQGSKEAQKMDDRTAATLASSDMAATLGALQLIKDTGATVELLGKEELQGTAAYKLKVTRGAGHATTYFLDAATFLPMKMISKISQMGQEMEVESFPSNYKKSSGIMFAQTIENKVQGKSMMNITVEKVETNVPADDAIFKLPAPEPPAEKKQ